MKNLKSILAVLILLCLLVSCGKGVTADTDGDEEDVAKPTDTAAQTEEAETEPLPWEVDGTVHINLSDEEITVNGEAISTGNTSDVYTACDIVYYEAGHDFTYGEGSEKDAHTAEEADAHAVVHISAPGTYTLSGKLSAGQIAIDLGEDAEKDPSAVVTLILDGVDITNTVAPAVIFYSVYECGSSDAESATKDVDTTTAGANVIIADGSVNYIVGSYVARIYKPDSVVLSADGSEVEEAKKLHKYDAAFYSKQSLNVNGGEAGDGVLNITAENEGLDSELHLTLNGGVVNILSGNDGINTNEDNVSVTTVNGGVLNIKVTGETGEGDGIDSNGWLVINDGTVIAQACAF
ncbi:MAG: carbohydrate-binding domain-containing protein, partial [Clostridia bacterium]|nr:carbohydrate-binding domain-containing protein [Clostridia bacterium]